MKKISPRPITAIAQALNLGEADFELFGRYKAKFELDLEARLGTRPMGKYVNVTAISPTPFGEGKTVTAIGLAMALCRLGNRATVTLREPSMAPVFGIKGGGTGGGRATLLPSDDINLHFTGDLHAVTSANNLLAALVDNHVKRGHAPRIPPRRVSWRRAIDMSDKGLSSIISGLGGGLRGPRRQTGFDLTAASEVMAIVALSKDLADLKLRLERIIAATDESGAPITAKELGASGAMGALLKDALRPNLVQTCEHTPAIVHTGPFGNIAHGNSSILADRIALKLSDYVVTESGFGSDCGAEKFFDIKCRISGLTPDAEVLVLTVRALKWHSGRFGNKPGQKVPPGLNDPNPLAVREGASNLRGHLGILRQFHVPIVVAINRFPSDTAAEIAEITQVARECGATSVVLSEVFAKGSEGGVELARAVEEACREKAAFQTLYPNALPTEEKLRRLATALYGAKDIEVSASARENMNRFAAWGFTDLPVCVAKTQYSLSHDPTLLGQPKGFTFPIRDLRLCAGAGFFYALAGEILTMPGLPAEPAAKAISVTDEGEILGIR